MPDSNADLDFIKDLCEPRPFLVENLIAACREMTRSQINQDIEKMLAANDIEASFVAVPEEGQLKLEPPP